MKYRYHKQYVREDFLLTKSPIFDLSKQTNLKQKGDLINYKKGKINNGPVVGLDRHGKPVLHNESQSLSNVLGF